MSRIKKRGLDYFPMNTDFLHNRLVRRILKREGDAALAVLLEAYCCIYSGEGYYVLADDLFYDDMADSLFQQEPADARRIIALAVESGLFDAGLYGRYGILTSADIQRQFLFITKRRTSAGIDVQYNLLPPEESSATADSTNRNAGKEDGSVHNTGNNVTFKAENDEIAHQSTQSIAKQSIVKQSIENPLLNSSPETGGTPCAGRMPAEEAGRKEEEMPPAGTRKPSREWTDEDISRLQSPEDGQRRNLDGLIYNLRQLHIPLPEQYAIILKSNFGIIGHPMWEGFGTLRGSHGRIRQPGRYLLSLCQPGRTKT